MASISLFIFATYYLEALSTSLIQFLAVLRINPKIVRLQTAKNYSYMLAGIVYCTQVVRAARLLLGSQRDTQTEQDCDYFIEMRRKYLADGTFTLISKILSLLAYGKFISLTASNSSNAYWSENKQTFYLNSRLIIISRFYKIAQDLIVEALEKLQELCQIEKNKERVTINLK